jgi:hypothetical protein
LPALLRKPKYISPQKNAWITPGLKKSSLTLRSLKSSVTNASNEFKAFVENYKRIYNKTVRAAKRLHINNKIINSENKSRVMWTVITMKLGNPVIQLNKICPYLKMMNSFLTLKPYRICS